MVSAQNMSPESAIRAGPSKGAVDENFPVGSWLLPAKLRPSVAQFYAVVRAADDIADHPSLSPQDKLRRLEAFDATLTGGEPASAEYAVAARHQAGDHRRTAASMPKYASKIARATGPACVEPTPCSR